MGFMNKTTSLEFKRYLSLLYQHAEQMNAKNKKLKYVVTLTYTIDSGEDNYLGGEARKDRHDRPDH